MTQPAVLERPSATEAPLPPPTVAPPVPLVDDKLVLWWFVLAGFGSIVGPVFGLLSAMKLDDPDFLSGYQGLQFGRFRIVHVQMVIFGAFTPAMFGLMCHAVPRLTGIREKPQLNDDKKMIPIVRFGLAIMSIGFLVEEDTAMIWRGPMVMSAITQMLRDVAWGTLDILVVDMPPGTGDAQLTLAQNVPLKGAIIISTPQDLSLIDARRGLAMFKKVNVPVLGIVENMSYFQCPHCGTRSDIFGHGGARHEAERLAVPFLGEIPLHMAIRVTSDSGTPVVESEPDGPHAAIYRAIGAKVRDQLQGVIAAA